MSLSHQMVRKSISVLIAGMLLLSVLMPSVSADSEVVWNMDTEYAEQDENIIDNTEHETCIDTVSSDQETVYKSVTEVLLPDCSKSGFRFIGWNTDPNGFGTMYYPGEHYDVISEDDHLYGIWEVIQEEQETEEKPFFVNTDNVTGITVVDAVTGNVVRSDENNTLTLMNDQYVLRLEPDPAHKVPDEFTVVFGYTENNTFVSEWEETVSVVRYELNKEVQNEEDQNAEVQQNEPDSKNIESEVIQELQGSALIAQEDETKNITFAFHKPDTDAQINMLLLNVAAEEATGINLSEENENTVQQDETVIGEAVKEQSEDNNNNSEEQNNDNVSEDENSTAKETDITQESIAANIEKSENPEAEIDPDTLNQTENILNTQSGCEENIGEDDSMHTDIVEDETSPFIDIIYDENAEINTVIESEEQHYEERADEQTSVYDDEIYEYEEPYVCQDQYIEEAWKEESEQVIDDVYESYNMDTDNLFKTLTLVPCDVVGAIIYEDNSGIYIYPETPAIELNSWNGCYRLEIIAIDGAVLPDCFELDFGVLDEYGCFLGTTEPMFIYPQFTDPDTLSNSFIDSAISADNKVITVQIPENVLTEDITAVRIAVAAYSMNQTEYHEELLWEETESSIEWGKLPDQNNEEAFVQEPESAQWPEIQITTDSLMEENINDIIDFDEYWDPENDIDLQQPLSENINELIVPLDIHENDGTNYIVRIPPNLLNESAKLYCEYGYFNDASEFVATGTVESFSIQNTIENIEIYIPVELLPENITTIRMYSSETVYEQNVVERYDDTFIGEITENGCMEELVNEGNYQEETEFATP